MMEATTQVTLQILYPLFDGVLAVDDGDFLGKAGSHAGFLAECPQPPL